MRHRLPSLLAGALLLAGAGCLPRPIMPAYADGHGLPCNARYIDVGAFYDQVHGFYVTAWDVYDARGFFCKRFYSRHLDPIPDPGSPVNHPPQPPHKG